MQITDTIADLLTRIRNANTAKHATVDVPASRVKKDITQILVDEGYVKGFQHDWKPLFYALVANPLYLRYFSRSSIRS